MSPYNGYYGEVASNIKTHGQHLQFVHGTGAEPSFIYTIGNALHGLPELLIIGNFPPSLTGMMLNQVGAKMRDDKAPLEEGLLDIGWSIPIKVRKAGPDAKTRFTIQVEQALKTLIGEYDVMQITLCDKEGRYAGDPGCDPDFDVEQP